MRWKLLLATSLVATVVGAGATLAIAFGLLGSPTRLNSPDAIVLATLLIPLAATITASYFVYRHTARRRRLQALLTALFIAGLTLTILILSAMFSARRGGTHTDPQPRQNNISRT
ncbi:MAG TPA: hypothetical protein VK619_09755 [Pyrinomonadaceae bacterium]|nr:hypothetical protein [Pyrinomonadaceae bacterium]